MRTYTPLSPDEVMEASILRRTGWTYQKIADYFGVNRSSVEYHLLPGCRERRSEASKRYRARKKAKELASHEEGWNRIQSEGRGAEVAARKTIEGRRILEPTRTRLHEGAHQADESC